MEAGVNVRWCIGEEVRPGRNLWGGWLPIIWDGILINNKNSLLIDIQNTQEPNINLEFDPDQSLLLSRNLKAKNDEVN